MSTSAIEQARIADDIEAAAYRDMYLAAPSELATALALRSMQVDGTTLLMAKGISDPVFARVIGLGNNDNSAPSTIDAITNAYRNAKIGNYWIHVNPVLAPRDFGALLEERGFTLAKRRTWAKMLRDTAPVPQIESAIIIHETPTNEPIATSNAITEAFGMPPPFSQWIRNMATRPNWTMVTALDSNRIVGGGLLYIENQHAWLGLGGVIPEARGLSAHRAIMAFRISIAIERGCTHIVTETGEPINNEPNPSLRNMYRLGFERVASRLNYVAQFKS